MSEHFAEITQSFDNANLRKCTEQGMISLVASSISEIPAISVKKRYGSEFLLMLQFVYNRGYYFPTILKNTCVWIHMHKCMNLWNAKWLIFRSIILCFLQVSLLCKVQDVRIKTGIHISVIFHNLQLLMGGYKVFQC